MQPSSGARYFMCVNSKGFGETGRLFDKYQNLMSWLISRFLDLKLVCRYLNSLANISENNNNELTVEL